jgi:hypothetical protein
LNEARGESVETDVNEGEEIGMDTQLSEVKTQKAPEPPKDAPRSTSCSTLPSIVVAAP